MRYAFVMNKPLILGLAGQMGSGKSLIGRYFKDHFRELKLKAETVAFADALKSDISVKLRIPDNKAIPGLRQIYQGYGQACKHLYGEDYWVERLNCDIKEKYAPMDVIIITDVRFAYEEKYIKDRKGLIHTVLVKPDVRQARLARRGDVDLKAQEDISEKYVASGDFILRNDGDDEYDLWKNCKVHVDYLKRMFC